MAGYNYLRASDGTGLAVLSHITVNRVVGSTVIKVDSVNKYPADFIYTTGTLLATGYLDPTTLKEMRCHVTAGDVIIDGFEPGFTDTGNTVGQVGIIKQTTGWADSVSVNAKVAHNDSGTIKDGAVSTAAMLGANVVTTAKIATGAVTATGINFGGAGVGVWWEEIGRAQVASGALSVTGLPARKYLKVLTTTTNNGATAFDCGIQFNGDTTSQYRASYSGAFGPQVDTGAATSIPLEASSVQQNGVSYGELDIVNIATISKVGKWTNTNNAPTAAMNHIIGAFRWIDTANLINRVDILRSGGGTFGAGSEIIVLGHD